MHGAIFLCFDCSTGPLTAGNQPPVLRRWPPEVAYPRPSTKTPGKHKGFHNAPQSSLVLIRSLGGVQNEAQTPERNYSVNTIQWVDLIHCKLVTLGPSTSVRTCDIIKFDYIMRSFEQLLAIEVVRVIQRAKTYGRRTCEEGTWPNFVGDPSPKLLDPSMQPSFSL